MSNFIGTSPVSFQRAHLLDNTEKLERSSRRLEAGYQIAVETGKSPVHTSDVV